MKKIVFFVVFILTMTATVIMPTIGHTSASIRELSGSVVKLFVTSNSVDYFSPWQSFGSKSSAGSGVIISGNRILTNAHVIEDQTFIQIKKESDSRKYTATVLAVGHDCDLALLTVEDESFFKGTTALNLGQLPQLQDTVTVLGYPKGGEKLSITEGVVSRIELSAYSQSSRKLLAVQIDAAINSGNSGGPVIKDGLLIGIAMQVLNTGQNIGYMIPTPVIQHFFKDLEDGSYDQFPIAGIDFLNTENPTLRKFYGIDRLSGGILVTNILPFSPADGFLKENDVVLKIDGVPIGQDGTYAFRGSERLAMPHLITSKQINDAIAMDVIRDKKRMQVTFPLIAFEPLVLLQNHFERPPYYIYGGMVFTVLTSDLLRTFGNRWWEQAPLTFNNYLIGKGRFNHEQRENIAVLLNVLPDDVNVGYHQFSHLVVESVNGEKYQSFKDFVLLLEKHRRDSEYTIIKNEQSTSTIINNENIDQIDQQILERNNIPARYTPLVQTWIDEAF